MPSPFCYLCEKVILAGAPYMPIMTAPLYDDGEPRAILCHVACHMRSIAGETAAILLEALDLGESPVRISVSEGSSLADELQRLAHLALDRL